MEALPRDVRELIGDLAVARFRPAYLRVDARGEISDLGGALDAFGLGDVRRGAAAAELLPVLVGLVVSHGDAAHVDTVEVAPERYASVSVFDNGGERLVILFDKTREVEAHRIAQQLANDMSLLRGERAAARSRRDVVDERRVAVVAVLLRGLAALAGVEQADDVERVAGLYARAIARPIVDEAGSGVRLFGETLYAEFGHEATTAAAPALAAAAAVRIVEAVAELDRTRVMEGGEAIGAAIGIASGAAVTGDFGGRTLRIAATMGTAPDRARRLAERAAAGTIVVDADTYASLGPLAAHCVKETNE